ncbi:hypothetical protein [Streptomyces sp. G45]|uniref:hypothetical protein n=1 Tax=Streptomyces sp. G45 TaxID=3406627 RepID=UPI003C1F977C
MSHIRTHGAYRTDGLWAATAIAFGVVVVGSGIALFGMVEFDEQCNHGLVRGPGRLLDVRNQSFPRRRSVSSRAERCRPSAARAC